MNALSKHHPHHHHHHHRHHAGAGADDDDDVMALESVAAPGAGDVEEQERVQQVQEEIERRRVVRLVTGHDDAMEGKNRVSLKAGRSSVASHSKSVENVRQAELEAMSTAVGPKMETRRAAPAKDERKGGGELQKARKKNRRRSSKDWFHMPKPTLTQEVKAQLDVVRLRAYTDPSRHYKTIARPGKAKYPEYFQFGTVIESSRDFYSSRLSKKERGATLVDELLNDARAHKYTSRIAEKVTKSRSARKRSGKKGGGKKGGGKRKRPTNAVTANINRIRKRQANLARGGRPKGD